MSKISGLRLLSPAQLRLFWSVILGTALLLGNSLYLWLVTPATDAVGGTFVMSSFYQLMLLLHVLLGVLLFVAASVFTAWHLKKALLRRTPGAVPTGLLTYTSAAFLLLTGLFLLTEANSRANAWAFLGHQITAVALPLVYLWHRLRSKDPIRWPGVRYGVVSVLGLALGMGVIHALTLPSPARERPAPPPPEAPEEWTALGIEDPFVPFVAVGDVPEERRFFPSGVTLDRGETAPAEAIHRGEHPAADRIRAEVASQGFWSSSGIGADSCRSCHPDVTAQWEQSVHRFASFNNPFYAEAVALTRERQGPQATQWCGGCHDHALLVTGELDGDFDRASAAAQTGLTCLSCHAIEKLHSNVGNGAFELRANPTSPYLLDGPADGSLTRFVHESLILAKPDLHRKRMSKPFFQQSEFCSTCHKVHLDVPVNDYRWIRGQDEYDAWQNSGFAHSNPMTWYEPPEVKTCQDCHMRREPAPLGDVAARDGTVKSHRFHSVNTGVAHLRGDEDALRRIAEERTESLRLDVFAVQREDGSTHHYLDHEAPVLDPGEAVELHVVARNKGIGHAWPGGTIDSNEAWIELKVWLDDELIAISGDVGEDRQVDPDARFYQGVFVDAEGNRIAQRNAPDIRGKVYVNVIKPSNSDLARYALKLPEGRSGVLRVQARMMWRKFNRRYTEFVFRKAESVPELPITAIASSSVRLAVGLASVEREPPAKRDWTRLNDYAIAWLNDDDPRRAAEAFEELLKLEPDRAEVHRNLARVYLGSNKNLPKALESLRRALELLTLYPPEQQARQEARTAFFFGRVYELRGGADLDAAEEAYKRSLQHFPRSRGAWERLAAVRWLRKDYEGSLQAALKVLEIDPESEAAHSQRHLIYKALAGRAEPGSARRRGLDFAAAEAQRAARKYQEDENADTYALDYKKRNAADNRMAQLKIVHPLRSPQP